jgi:hypothetical protein
MFNMRFSFTVLACALFLAVSLPAAAQPAAAAATPAATKQDSLDVWHHQIVAHYKKVRYLDMEGKPIAAEAFLAKLAKHETGLNMTTPRPDRGEMITLQLRVPEPVR